MYRIISDQAQMETSENVLDLLRVYIIDNWNGELHQQQQNHIEEKFRHIKRKITARWDALNHRHIIGFLYYYMYVSY